MAHWRKLTEPVVEKWLKEMKEQKTDGGKLFESLAALVAAAVWTFWPRVSGATGSLPALHPPRGVGGP